MEWRNLQQFLLMRAGRRVHAAGAIEAGQFQLTLTTRKLTTVRRGLVHRDYEFTRTLETCLDRELQTRLKLLLAKAKPR
jgi:hypothetical protein